MTRTSSLLALVLFASVHVVSADQGADHNAARTEHARGLLSSIARTTPTVKYRTAASVVDIEVHGTFPSRTTDPNPGNRAVQFLEQNSLARELGFIGRSRVRTVSNVNPQGPIVVRLDFYEGDVQIGGEEAIVHLSGDEITYIGGTFPVRPPTKALAGAASPLSVDQVRSIVLDRLRAKGWTPDNRWTVRYQIRYDNGDPYDPVTDIKMSLLVPQEGPDLVYDVNTTGAGYGFWVDAHSGQIVREDPPFEPGWSVGTP